MNFLRIFILSVLSLSPFICLAFQYVPFNEGWKFSLGDIETAREPNFNDSKWRVLDLPHDWSIEGSYHRTANGTDWQSGFLPAGIGWYRKSFQYDEKFRKKKIQIQFDGVYLNSEVYINGVSLGKRPNGYIGFVYDLTPHLRKGKNVISVKADHSKPLTGRWYTGSGIYRPVYLLLSERTHINYSGIYFRTEEVSSAKANYLVDIEISGAKNQSFRVETILKDKTGKVVSQSFQSVYTVEDNALTTVRGAVANPKLWSPETPNTYTLVCRLLNGDKIIDDEKLLIGFRSLDFDARNGFLLNGQPYKLKGVCDHHTAGAVGAAVPNDILYYRLKLLKEMGCNAIRTAHNPFSPDFYNICDTLGILVLNEGLDGWEKPKARDDYGNYFEEWWKRDMTDFIKRDRNHPSVFMWSIGNEVRGATNTTQKKLLDLFHELDPSRPVTQGGVDPTRNMKADYEKSFSALDVIGFNGNGEEVGEFEKFRQEFPDLLAIATEVPHTYQTRGVYRTKTQLRRRDFPAPWELANPIPWNNFEKRVFPIPNLSERETFPEEIKNRYYQSSYDNASVRISARQSWKRTASFPWLMGEFRWGSFDYLGEAEWPQRCGNFGIIDVAAIPKDHYYLYQSLWTDKPVVHILPHWTHAGKEGVEIPVVVYTNCDEVELFINDRSLGKKEYKGEQLVWNIPYSPGKIMAKATKKNKVVSVKTIETAGIPYSFKARTNKSVVNNKSDIVRVEIDIIDKKRSLNPHASNTVHFKTTGPIKILAVDNGDPVDHVRYKSGAVKAFRGKCVVLLQSDGKIGSGTLHIESKGLQSKNISITVK